jgi:hypothetical protein
MTKNRALLGSLAGLLLVIAIILGVASQCEGLLDKVVQADQDAVPDRRGVSTPKAATPTVEPDHTEAFKKSVMRDRTGEPDWLAKVTRVRFTAAGALIAETTFPANWRDASTPSRPVESICTQLFVYLQGGTVSGWQSVIVLAADGTTLISRKDPRGSCRQQ